MQSGQRKLVLTATKCRIIGKHLVNHRPNPANVCRNAGNAGRFAQSYACCKDAAPKQAITSSIEESQVTTSATGNDPLSQTFTHPHTQASFQAQLISTHRTWNGPFIVRRLGILRDPEQFRLKGFLVGNGYPPWPSQPLW